MAVTVKLDTPEYLTIWSAPNEKLLVAKWGDGDRVFFKAPPHQINYLNGACSQTGLGFDAASTFSDKPCRLLRKGESVLIEGD